MKNRWYLASAVALLACAGAVIAADEAKISLEGITCPISGKKVVAESETKYKDGVVFFCCQNCPKAFEKDTAKFAAKANSQLVATKQYAEVKCPLTGKDLNTATAIKVNGVEVCFCCNSCKGKATKAEGAEQIELVFGDKAFEKGFKPAKKE